MNQTQIPGPVVVGIDGWSSAVHAAEWAIDEAVSRDVALRLIHVIQSTSTDIHRESDHAEAALEAARAAILQTDQPVKIETAIGRGPVAATLAAESVGAQLVCIGSEGSARRATKYRGTIAAAVAQLAQCPVAIIRTHRDAPRSESDDIAVIIDDAPNGGAVLEAALDEARLRNATLLALKVAPSRVGGVSSEEVNRRLTDWLGRYPDVQTHTLMVPQGISPFIAERDPPVQLAVMGNIGGDAVARLIDPYDRFVLRHTHCSILLVPA
jgi:nucleotide-binding universal stress UspA family protein